MATGIASLALFSIASLRPPLNKFHDFVTLVGLHLPTGLCIDVCCPWLPLKALCRATGFSYMPGKGKRTRSALSPS